MLHFVSARATGQTVKRLFWMRFDVDQPLPWLVFSVLAVGGFLVARWMAPRLAAAWDEAHPHAQAGLGR